MDMQNVAKLDIPEGEVRTIHDKDGNLIWGKVNYGVKYKGDTAQTGTPAPSAPVAVQTVTGEQTISINGAAHTVNLGSIELCKIGTYQDYIYKSGGKWYVHKAVGKITFDENAAWTKHGTTAGNVFMLGDTGFIGYGYGGNAAPALMDTARVIALGSMPDSANGVFGVTNGSQLRVFRGAYDASYTAGTFKTEMVGHYIYGALATPTDTEITNEALVAQLEAVEQWLTRYGYNATVTGNLPIIIDRTAL